MIAVIVIAVLAGFFYWQSNKRTIIENKIDKVLLKKTDNLFTLTYDSSFIDELNGNASFYNVSLLSDTTIAAEQDAKNMYEVHIAEVAIKGANLIGLLTGNTLQAKSIQFINPVFDIIKRNHGPQPYTKEDTLALYEQILGKYKSIKTEEIIIDNGAVNISSDLNKSVTAIKDIDVTLSNFKIDSTKDYELLVSYFIKGLEAKVGSVTESSGAIQQYSLAGINFSAANRMMRVSEFQLFKNNKVVTNLTNLSLNGLETSVFLRDQRMVANELKTDGGLLTVYRKKGSQAHTLETDSTVFDKAKIRKVTIGKTKVVIIDKDEPNEPPLELSDVELTAVDIPAVDGSLTRLIAQSNWVVQGSGLRRISKDKIYDIAIGPYVLNKAAKSASIQYFTVTPKISEAAFVKSRKVQEDFFEISCKDIRLSNVDLEEAFSKQVLRVSEASLQPNIKIFNDRTIPRNPTSKVPTDPAQLIKNLPLPIAIGKLVIRNGYLSYRERGMISEKTGMLFFDNLNASISNITNIASNLSAKSQMILKASTRFQGKTKFETTWQLPLNKVNSPFILDGKLSGIDGGQLNPVLEPLAMISIKKGYVNSFAFQTTGDYSQAHTKGTFLYEDLKLNMLRKESQEKELQKKTALSFLANIFIDDRNPGNGKVRQNEVDFKRDSTRSFFYLVSQSFFLAIRKTITGRNNVK